MSLSAEQLIAVEHNGHVVVRACPGSGKTRVLLHRVMRGLNELASTKQRIIALTFTNRAADEIQARLDLSGIETEQLWTGTMHSFALEWIVRPYSAYLDKLKRGFAVADEHYTQQVIDELLVDDPLPGRYDQVTTARARTGANPNSGLVAARIYERYRRRLETEKLLDYDDILFYSYQLLRDRPEIAETLAAIMPLICVDETQDIQDLHYAVLSQIVTAQRNRNTLYFVGDLNQCIYQNLGALPKTTPEIALEFGFPFRELTLSKNFRSTQRLVDYFTRFRSGTGPIVSLAAYAGDRGAITFFDQTIDRHALVATIIPLVRKSLAAGIPAEEICILAPHWAHVIPLARELVLQFPEVPFDAPGLSPLHSSRENIWFKVARLFLTSGNHLHQNSRPRWAKEVIHELERDTQLRLPASLRTSRLLLRSINSTVSAETDGLAYLREVFGRLNAQARIDLAFHPDLAKSQNDFFARAQNHLVRHQGAIPTDVNALRKLFGSREGIVVSTCHGVKGEEFTTVIAFGLLQGYIPNWQSIIHGTGNEASEEASKLLYVICSRAKKHLHLIAECGRLTASRRPYHTSEELAALTYSYDQV